MKRKRLIAALAASICLCVSLTACFHEHTWAEATCTEPKTCTECGETEGEPLGHEEGDWEKATSASGENVLRKRCARCGEVLEEEIAPALSSDVVTQIPDSLMDDAMKASLDYLVTPFSQSGLDREDTAENTSNGFEVAGGTFLGSPSVAVAYYGLDSIDGTEDEAASSIGVRTETDYSLGELGERICAVLGCGFTERDEYGFSVVVPNTSIELHGTQMRNESSADLLIVLNEDAAVNDAPVSYDSYESIPDALMDETLKSNLSYFDASFADSGLSRDEALTDEKTAFQLENGSIAGNAADRTTVTYNSTESGSEKPYQISMLFYTELDGDGSEETIELAEDIARAAGVGSLEEDQSGAYILRIGGVNLRIAVENYDGYVKVSILKQ